MAEKRDYTPYQQRVIRNFYRNQEQSRAQSLDEIVADIWLAKTDAKRDALWKKAEALLLAIGVRPETVAQVVEKRRVEGLAGLAAKAQSTPPSTPKPRPGGSGPGPR
jgi:hypothetical protein